ncbi:hypothetical protein [Flexivirga oryzae]|uniref:Uncharacterized protein n=1 Tax=Flexivirga oryzae TaxID=1794944 RepID=A0A839N7C9_9MICO|nr:hypothetical protein [Flexivirga oryzae]MBB2891125.1 hypothetical protein [Flexivirga oryzae]
MGDEATEQLAQSIIEGIGAVARRIKGNKQFIIVEIACCPRSLVFFVAWRSVLLGAGFGRIGL